jgi:hypothetical protein
LASGLVVFRFIGILAFRSSPRTALDTLDGLSACCAFAGIVRAWPRNTLERVSVRTLVF